MKLLEIDSPSMHFQNPFTIFNPISTITTPEPVNPSSWIFNICICTIHVTYIKHFDIARTNAGPRCILFSSFFFVCALYVDQLPLWHSMPLKYMTGRKRIANDSHRWCLLCGWMSNVSKFSREEEYTGHGMDENVGWEKNSHFTDGEWRMGYSHSEHRAPANGAKFDSDASLAW